MFYIIKNHGKYILLLLLLITTEAYSILSVKNLPSRNAYFTGRASYLDDMQKKLSQYHMVYLVGYGGVGKSQLAKEYSYINEKKYDLIWWFDLNSDLIAQYENLLVSLSNNKTFKGLLNINVNSIAPSVLVDFTNSLLSICDCKWLLIFDNALSNQDIKLPKPKKSTLQHIIITTRKNQRLGDNIFTLESFTNQESEIFLSKIHPKEKKEEVAKLYKVLHNYPLALAQVSEEILMHKDGIGSYFKRCNNLNKETVHMQSDITQEYSNNYHEVLNMTLQDIEQKDEEIAKILYMLTLLPVDLTKSFLKDLFGNKVEEKLITLSSYGVLQAVEHNNFQVLNIHDVIKDEVLRKFNNKNKRYKDKVVSSLIKNLSNLYSDKDFQYFNQLNLSDNYVTTLHKFIDIALQNNIINDQVAHAVTIALRLNSKGIYKYANLDLHQQLSSKVFNKNLKDVSPIKRALLYANLIYSDFIFETEERFLKYEKEYLQLLSIIEKSENHKELFFIHTCLSFSYIILGNFKEAKKYIEKAQKNINYNDNVFNLYEHLYIKAWIFYELREIDAGIRVLEEYENLNIDQSLHLVARLFMKDLKIKFMLLKGQINEAKKEVEEAIKSASSYYNDTPSNIVGELEYTKTMVYYESGQYRLAEKQGHRALDMLTEAFGGDIVDLTQAHIHIILGKIHEEKGSNALALEEYKRALSFYDKKSCGKANNNFYEYGDLLSNLSAFYYKQKNFVKSQFYFQKLVLNFGLDHDIMERLIKKLPRECMYQIGGGGEKLFFD